MPKKFLKHIETITSHRDTALLDKSVITSLRELLHVDEILLYDVVHLPDQVMAAVTTWSDADGVYSRHDAIGNDDYRPVTELPKLLSHVLPHHGNTGVPTPRPRAKGLHHILPVSVDRQTIACCEIRYTRTPTAHQRDLAEGILGLYRNYLALLEDSQIDTLTGLSNRKTFEIGRASWRERV